MIILLQLARVVSVIWMLCQPATTYIRTRQNPFQFYTLKTENNSELTQYACVTLTYTTINIHRGTVTIVANIHVET